MTEPVMMLAAMALSTVAATAPSDCRVLLVSKQRAEEVLPADTAAVGCEVRSAGKPQAVRLVYDARRRMVLAREALAAGEHLGRVYFPQRPEVRAGDHLSLTAHIGHVMISREVVALQDAEVGQRFFVRDRDGQVFVMPKVEADAQP